MKMEEVKKVIKIILTADGGCRYCVSALLKLFYKEFPEYQELAKHYFYNEFGSELELEDIDKSKYHLHGWNDEKVYFGDGEKEICVSDEKDLYEHLLEICIRYLKKKRN